MKDDEVINFMAKLGAVRRALHILETLRGIHTQNKFRIDIHVAESGPYEETMWKQDYAFLSFEMAHKN